MIQAAAAAADLQRRRRHTSAGSRVKRGRFSSIFLLLRPIRTFQTDQCSQHLLGLVSGHVQTTAAEGVPTCPCGRPADDRLKVALREQIRTSQVRTLACLGPESLPPGSRTTPASADDTQLLLQKFGRYFSRWFLRHLQRKSRKTAKSGAGDKTCLEGINEVSASDWLMMGFHRGGGVIVCRGMGTHDICLIKMCRRCRSGSLR